MQVLFLSLLNPPVIHKIENVQKADFLQIKGTGYFNFFCVSASRYVRNI
jgi:hypothetical protein